MVGKVVGKRRKRPLPDSGLGGPKTNPWNASINSIAMPSPASTHVSESSNKRNCMSNEWTSLISYDGQSPFDFSTGDEHFLNFDLYQDSGSSSNKDSSIIANTGLPTPSMSPPNMQFLAPSDLENCSRHNEAHRVQGHSDLAEQTARSQYGSPQVVQMEDDESACLRVLTHLKRYSSQQRQPLKLTLSLAHRTNATVKRLLRSRTIRSDYTCHLLMTSIMLHLASMYERTWSVMQPPPSKVYSDQEFINEYYLTENDQETSSNSTRQDTHPMGSTVSIKNHVHESAVLCSQIGDLLKRKPLQGFQTLGRHESTLIEVGLRFREVLSTL